MIIGVSGKINSGKDTIGTIIQYLTSNESGTFEASTMAQKVYGSLYPTYTNWEIRKFADKLKECISLITGISRANLEKEDVKSSDLGDAWERWYCFHYKLTNDSNPKGRISRYLATQEEVEKEHDLLSNNVNWHQFKSERLTVRKLLQEFGTEVGRSIHPNFWVNALFNDYKATGFYHCDLPEDHPKYKEDYDIYPNWIITDVRFPNELAAIKERGGVVIRVNREDERSRFAAIDKPEERSKYYHSSETSLDNATFDYTIDNNGTIDDLIIKVREILIKEKIIK